MLSKADVNRMSGELPVLTGIFVIVHPVMLVSFIIASVSR
jgi:hypothetical protein